MELKIESGWVYGLKCVRADMTSRDGFQWPESGRVEAPGWSPVAQCGNGLHAWAWGEGDTGCCEWSDDSDARWLIVRTQGEVIDLDGKCKAQWWEVVAVGDRDEVCSALAAACPGKRVNYGTATAGDSGTATAGDDGTATAGDRGTATAGDRGTATAGYSGTATAGYRGTATAGDYGTATAGDCGTATAGDYGTATAGYRGTATAGDYGTATACYRGTATAGVGGVISMIRYDRHSDSWLRTIAACEPSGPLKPNIPYRLDETGQFVPAVE